MFAVGLDFFIIIVQNKKDSVRHIWCAIFVRRKIWNFSILIKSASLLRAQRIKDQTFYFNLLVLLLDNPKSFF